MTDIDLALPDLLGVLADASARPRYAFMVLNLIATASGETGRAGPYIQDGEAQVPVREWLCDALSPLNHRNPRRAQLAARVRCELEASARLPADAAKAEAIVEEEVRERVRTSGKTNVSRAVSDLVKAGLLKRHYQGYRVDHSNRGGQRHAVYTVPGEVRAALAAAQSHGGRRAAA